MGRDEPWCDFSQEGKSRAGLEARQAGPLAALASAMKSSSDNTPLSASKAAWLTTGLFAVAAPAAAMWLLAASGAPDRFAGWGAPILVVGLMGAGIIGGAASGSLATGVALAVLAGGGLFALALLLGSPAPLHPASAALACAIASLSFAARGALFARSAGDKGWWIALFVVFGEVSIIATALAMPGALPDWLLVLLPAQWASTAIAAALSGTGTLAAAAPLVALAGTAAATLLVALLWPRRWPYAIMFTTWLACSALVWHWPALAV